MSKELNIIEAMKMPVGTEFTMIRKFSNVPNKVYIDNDTCFRWKRNDEPFSPYVDNMLATFIPIQQPVSFMEAIKAGSEGKRIKVDVTELNEKYSFGFHCVLNSYWNNVYKTINEIFAMLSHTEKCTMKIIEEGKWYIEESEEE
jgi:hypothetical protein